MGLSHSGDIKRREGARGGEDDRLGRRDGSQPPRVDEKCTVDTFLIEPITAHSMRHSEESTPSTQTQAGRQTDGLSIMHNIVFVFEMKWT